MKNLKTLAIVLLTLVAFAACHPKENVMMTHEDGSKLVTNTGNHWKYYYLGGPLFAECDIDEKHPNGTNWKFYNKEGKDLITESYDSLNVVETGQFSFPTTIQYYKTVDGSIETTQQQYYTTGALRSNGKLVNGLREGHWLFYHANGQPQTDAIFQNGIENGFYTVYRESGIPYFRGLYINGQRAGTWEIYDEEANLVATQNYDKPLE